MLSALLEVVQELEDETFHAAVPARTLRGTTDRKLYVYALPRVSAEKGG